MPDATSSDIQDWWEHLIEDTRQKDTELEPHLTLSNPCQIETFWLDTPIEAQLIINTTDHARPDKEILIHGPYQGHEFVDEIAEISQEPRWQEPHTPFMREYQWTTDSIKSDALALATSRFANTVIDSVFTDYSSFDRPFIAGERLWDTCYAAITLGNITEYDTTKFFTSTGSHKSEESTDGAERTSIESDKQNDETTTGLDAGDGENNEIAGGGGYIYPAVWVDGPPEKAFQEKVWGTPEMQYDIMLREEFHDEELNVLRDGLIVVLTQDGEKIRDILNTIFSIGIFLDADWRLLQHRELVSVSLDSSGVKSSFAEISSRRGDLLHADQSTADTFPRGIFPVEALQEIIRLAEAIFPEEDLREKLLLHLQAHTHFLDQEYTASFLLNWIIIEQQISHLLLPHLRDEYGVNHDRRRNMERSHWSISHLLDVAEITGVISNDVYSELDDFRKNRNDIVHKMESAHRDEAEELQDIVSELLADEIISITDKEFDLTENA